MPDFRPYFNILIPSELVAAHLRGELLRGRWNGTMPGVPALGAELGVDPKTAGLALPLLEEDSREFPERLGIGHGERSVWDDEGVGLYDEAGPLARVVGD